MSESATDVDTKLVAGLWQVVARHGWNGLTMRRVSDASGLFHRRSIASMALPTQVTGCGTAECRAAG